MNVETIDALRKRMAEPCPKCVKEVFKYLMDPQVQGLFEPWIKEREGLIQLHVHGASTLTRGAEGILFLMAIHITKEIQILYFTPGSTSVEGAFGNLKEVVAREKKRLSEKKGDANDAGRRTENTKRKTRDASENERR